MWRALFTALFSSLLDWLTGLVKGQSRTAGEDVEAKPGLRARLNTRLAAWKAGKGAG
jgi:hypothetical protein